MYLTQSELEEVFDNVRRLRHEFGGRWITTDNELIKGQGRLLSLLVDGDEDEIKAIEKMAADNMPKVALAQNSFFRPDEVERFISERGFDLEKLPLFDYLPDELRSLEQLPPDKRQAARDVFKDVYLWVMTPKPVAVREDVREEKDFKAQMRMRGGDLEITVSGRLDTITAPTLLAMFRDAETEHPIASVTIDMANLVYISSAGLRVLILMLKALEDEDHLNLINMSKAVREIIETTGLDTLMC
jgi:anti-anti-sigma factor